MSRSKIGDETDTSLFDFFKSRYGGEKSQTFLDARRCFIESMAAYSVFCYLLQVKDRHNGNIMISDQGHVIHIGGICILTADFGFLFETSPGGNLGWEPDFKLTEEMLQIMGGRADSPHFQYFTELCIKAFLAIRLCLCLLCRPYTDSILTLVTLMTDSGFPCFRGNSIRLLSSRLSANLSYRGAAQHMKKIIDNCFLSIRARTYDVMQYVQNRIAY
ncbi:putative phosphatidylinositol 4-kinase alpha-like protein P2 [Octopus sinensis]|uniref:Phosphatidylinositol 4-kinase alpha-like protein P2 n=1 Tax=Octopus sinensis TaxID=2607531 RepID=A0A6P7U511_9MOLL|nr:putative phosphatidylinositol 4-kinase alpha-like protein P2 [Octopus sinensis]